MTQRSYKCHEIPASYLKPWQKIIDGASEIYDVPAALIMRVWPEQIEVLVSSIGDLNPYRQNEMADLGTGLYCETVMATRQQLFVPNAMEDPEWEKNPDVRLNMIHYLGVPLVWPNAEIFGTICVLDTRTRQHSAAFQKLLWALKGVIEADFEKIEARDKRRT